MRNTLRTLAGTTLIALTVCLTGCSKDPEDLIIGSWNEVRTETTTTSNVSSTPATDVHTLGAGESVVMTFREDNSFTTVQTANNTSMTTSGTYTISDEKLTLTVSEGHHSSSVFYYLDDINKEEMILSMTESYVEDDITFTANEILYFEKQ